MRRYRPRKSRDRATTRSRWRWSIAELELTLLETTVPWLTSGGRELFGDRLWHRTKLWASITGPDTFRAPPLHIRQPAPPSCCRLDDRRRHTTRRRLGLRPERPLHIARARPRAHQLGILSEPIAHQPVEQPHLSSPPDPLSLGERGN